MPQATIVVASSALQPAQNDVEAQKINTAAHDLQDYLKKMSGAVLPLVGDDKATTGTVILVGASRLTKSLNVEIPSGITWERREEGFIIQCTADRLVLAGNDVGPYHGTEYATYELLNRLGVRWFMPGDYGEVVPSQSTIRVDPISIREKPDFSQRNWWFTTTPEMAALEKRWKIRNKMNPENMFDLPEDGSVEAFLPPKEEAAVHPELFAQNADGSVNTTMPNLSNPDSVKYTAEKVKAYFRQHPEAASLGMAPADGIPRDFTPDTLKLNQGFTQMGGREGVPEEVSGTEEWIQWIDAVTREVNKEFPDRVITTNGYANRSLAPVGVKIDPHVGIMFAALWSDTIHALDNPLSWQMIRQAQLLHDWTKLSDKVFIYGYDYIVTVSGLTPIPGTHKLAHDYPLMKKWGVIGFDNESRNIWMERGTATRYLNARLMWNANLDVPAVLDDYYQKWYGAAARPAHAFWEALENAMENTPMLGHEDRILPWVYTPSLMEELQKDIGLAEAAAVAPKEKLHVRVDRLIFEHLKAYVAMNQAELNGDYAEATRQGEQMLAQRVKLAAINSFYTLPSEKEKSGGVSIASGVWYWTIKDRQQYYQRMIDQMSGQSGTLLALLPTDAAFALDPRDEGRFAGWYQSDWNTRDWNSVTTKKPFYLQGPEDHPYMDKSGYPYMGAMWYQFKVNVPPVSPGSKVRLSIPILETEGWLWMNGVYSGHRPYQQAYARPNEMDVDVTAGLKPGALNIITLRVATSLNSAACADGILGRSYLYVAHEAPLAPTEPPKNKLIAWLSADKGVAAGAGGEISNWADQSGNQNDASQAVPANQPKLISNALNGHPAIAFNGKTTYLSLAKPLDLTAGMSLFIVAKNDIRKDYNGLFQLGNKAGLPFTETSLFEACWTAGSATGTGSGDLDTVVNRGDSQNIGLTLQPDAPPKLNSYYIYNYNSSSGDYPAFSMLIDNVSLSDQSGARLPGSPGYGTIGVGYGGYNGAGGNFAVLQGEIAEVLLYSNSLSKIDRQTVYNYLNHKYHIPEGPPLN